MFVTMPSEPALPALPPEPAPPALPPRPALPAVPPLVLVTPPLATPPEPLAEVVEEPAEPPKLAPEMPFAAPPAPESEPLEPLVPNRVPAAPETAPPLAPRPAPAAPAVLLAPASAPLGSFELSLLPQPRATNEAASAPRSTPELGNEGTDMILRLVGACGARQAAFATGARIPRSPKLALAEQSEGRAWFGRELRLFPGRKVAAGSVGNALRNALVCRRGSSEPGANQRAESQSVGEQGTVRFPLGTLGIAPLSPGIAGLSGGVERMRGQHAARRRSSNVARRVAVAVLPRTNSRLGPTSGRLAPAPSRERFNHLQPTLVDFSR